ncbi:Transposable element Tc3 transposase [Araneus ventricosus]|uniref:Transposable element Tc3 transposase n=1 Tax=Araneus ventricosus TaxID=182803 RepID=A0A4Y2M711_ARAVE|nr:Transposable element Tc3 transposase [Araneus ventricosus]
MAQKGLPFYWHDMRKEEEIFSKKQQGGGSLMVWGGFGYGGKLNLAFPSGRMKATDYQEMLETHLLQFADRNGGPNWIFQQDNAPIHVEKSS